MVAVLQVEEIYKRFGRRQVLRGVSLQAEAGQVVGLIGENGSGKTTLLRIIVGLLRANKGKVSVQGSLGYCPQEPVVFDSLTVEENLLYFATAYGLNRSEGLGRGKELLERFQCQQYIRMVTAHLSGGTRQKLNLILALLHDPTLLVLDEPYQGFDYESYMAFWSLADELKRKGRCVLVVSHLIYDSSHLSSLYRLQEGKAING